MKKFKQLDISDYKNRDGKAIVEEFVNMLDSHKKRFHNDGSKPCVLCRSLRRNILRGLAI